MNSFYEGFHFISLDLNFPSTFIADNRDCTRSPGTFRCGSSKKWFRNMEYIFFTSNIYSLLWLCRLRSNCGWIYERGEYLESGESRFLLWGNWLTENLHLRNSIREGRVPCGRIRTRHFHAVWGNGETAARSSLKVSLRSSMLVGIFMVNLRWILFINWSDRIDMYILNIQVWTVLESIPSPKRSTCAEYVLPPSVQGLRARSLLRTESGVSRHLSTRTLLQIPNQHAPKSCRPRPHLLRRWWSPMR